MNERTPAATYPVLTRRELVKNIAWAGAILAAFPHAIRIALANRGQAAQARTPVVWFYMDRLCLDDTGTAIPYTPPRGMRSAAPLADVSDEVYRCAQVYI